MRMDNTEQVSSTVGNSEIDLRCILNETTPLLRGHSRQTSLVVNKSECTDALLKPGTVGDGCGHQPDRLHELKEATCSLTNVVINEDSDEDDECIAELVGVNSPYLGGVSKKRFWLLFLGILLQYFIACFDGTMISSIHPNITSYFEASDSASWLSTAFLVVHTAFQPLFSRISDTIGRRPVYFVSLVIFCLGNLWCALAQSIQSLVFARALCGLGAGGTLAMGAILTNDLVPMQKRGFYQALIGLFYESGAMTGAAFGGFLCDTIGWRWTFGVQIPPLLCVLALGVLATPKDLGPQLAKKSPFKSIWEVVQDFDLAGSFLLTTTVSLLILGLNLGGNILPWSDPAIIIALLLSVVAGMVLIRVQKQAARPIMPLKLLTTSPRGNFIFHNFLTLVGTNAVVFNAPLYFQVVHMDSPSMSGFRLLGPSMGVCCCSVASGMIMNATGRPKPLVVIGSLVSLAGGLAMAALYHGVSVTGATMAVFFPVTGTGIAFPAAAIANLAFSSKEDEAVVSTTQLLWMSLGVVMGVSLSSLLVQNALPYYLEKFVRGESREEIIHLVHKSVHSIWDLDSVHRAQVQLAYERTLRLAFIFAAGAFTLALALVVPVKLGRLDYKKSKHQQITQFARSENQDETS